MSWDSQQFSLPFDQESLDFDFNQSLLLPEDDGFFSGGLDFDMTEFNDPAFLTDETLPPVDDFPNWDSESGRWSDETILPSANGNIVREPSPKRRHLDADAFFRSSQLVDSDALGSFNDNLVAMLPNREFEGPSPIQYSTETASVAETTNDIRITACDTPMRTKDQLRKLRRKYRPDMFYRQYKEYQNVSRPQYFAHFDHLRKNAIEQPPDGEEVKADHESCATCIRYCIPCKGTSVDDGRCECCRGEHKKRKRRCLWIKPDDNLWTYPDLQNADRIAKKGKIPANTAAGMREKEAHGRKHREGGGNKRKVHLISSDDKSNDDSSYEGGSYSLRPSSRSRRSRKTQEPSRSSEINRRLTSQREGEQDLGDMCDHCAEHGLVCNRGLPCQNCIDDELDFCTYVDENRICAVGDERQEIETALRTDDTSEALSESSHSFLAIALQQPEKVQEALRTMANRILQRNPMLLDANINRESFLQEALVAFQDMARVGMSVGIIDRVSIPYAIIDMINFLADNSIGIHFTEIQSLATR